MIQRTVIKIITVLTFLQAGFQSDVLGVDKISETLPAEISERFSKGSSQ